MTVWQDIGRSLWGACLFALFQGRGLALYRTDWTWVAVSYVGSSLVTAALWLAMVLPGAPDGMSGSWGSALLFLVLFDGIAILVGVWFRFSERWRLFFVNYCWVSVPVYFVGLLLSAPPLSKFGTTQGFHEILSGVFLAYYLALIWFQIRRPLSTTFGQTFPVFAAFLAVLVADWQLISLDWEM